MKLLSLLWVPRTSRLPVRVQRTTPLPQQGSLGSAAAQFGYKYISDKGFRQQVNQGVADTKNSMISVYKSGKKAFREASEVIQDGKRLLGGGKQTMPPILSVPGQITRSKYADVRKAPSYYKKMIATGSCLTFNNDTSIRTASTSGTQGIVQRIVNDLPQLTTYDARTSAQILTSSATNSLGLYTNQWFLRSTVEKLTITNACANSVDLKLYEIVRRDDMCGPDGAPANTFDYQSLLRGPLDYWAAVTQYDTQTGTTAPTVAFPGNIPTQYRSWNKFFKVVKVFPITLQPGSSHIHESVYSPYSAIGGSLLLPFLSGAPTGAIWNGGYAGITRYQMIVFNGMPVHDSNDFSNVTLGSAALNLVRTVSTTVDTYQFSNKTSIVMNTLPVIASTANERVWSVNTPTDFT